VLAELPNWLDQLDTDYLATIQIFLLQQSQLLLPQGVAAGVAAIIQAQLLADNQVAQVAVAALKVRDQLN
jgi:hypothetical protein